ncbi:MAG: LamG-like jellyroll fold domain-containing protein [Pirellulaceae bacterium]
MNKQSPRRTFSLVAFAIFILQAGIVVERCAGAADQAGLILQYTLDGAVADSSAGRHDGTITGQPAFVAGHRGQCLKVDGSTWIDTGLTSPDMGNEFTVECWLNPASTQQLFAGIFGTETATGNGFTLDQWQSDTNSFTANFGVGGGQYVRSDLVPLRPGVWQHVAYVKTSEGNALWVNGIPVAAVFDKRPLAASPGTLCIGRGGQGVPCFQGLIDDLRVWNRALTEFPHAGIEAGQAIATVAAFLTVDIEVVTADPAQVPGCRVTVPDRVARLLPAEVNEVAVSVAARRMDFGGSLREQQSWPALTLTRAAGFRGDLAPPADLAPGCWFLELVSRIPDARQVVTGKVCTAAWVLPARPLVLTPELTPDLQLAVPATTPPTRLAAGWRILTDPDNQGRSAKWFEAVPPDARPAVVPGTIQQSFPGYHGVAWYWTFVNAPVLDAKQNACRVHFGGVDYYAEVWLNGQYLGEHEGADAPFAFDATSALRGGENLLAVRVINPGREAVDGFRITEVPHSFKQADHFVFGGNANSGGILLPVELRCEPLVRVKDLYCRPDSATGHVTLQLTLDNATAQPVVCRLASSIERQDSGHSIAECGAVAEVTAAPGESEYILPLAVPQPKLWSPGEPNMYWATASLCAKQAEGETVHACRERFGIRDFRVGADGYFRLNGRRLFLKSCHTVNNFPVALGVAHKPELATRELLYAKVMGFDMVRFLGGPPLPEQLRCCDEIGLMVYAEPRASWCLGDSPRMVERFSRSLSQMILRDRNHPSITVWGLLNETGEGPVFRQAVACLPLTRALDDTRLVLLSSGRWDNRRQLGSLSNPGSHAWETLWGDELCGEPDASAPTAGPYLMGDVHRYMRVPHITDDIRMLRTLGGAERPVFLSEYGVGSLVNCVRLARLHEQEGSPPELEDFAAYRAMADQLAVDLKRYGMDQLFSFPEDLLRESERLHVMHRVLGYNAIRANPKLCGYSLTGIIDQPAGEGLLTEWREPKLGIVDAIRDCLAPLRWCLFVEPMHVYAGRPFRIEAVMANDGVLGPGDYPCRFNIRGPSGTVWEKSASLHIPAAESLDQVPLATAVVSEDITLDGPAGVYTLAANLERGGAASGTRLEFHLSRSADLPEGRGSVAVWGVAESAQRWLATHGVTCRPLAEVPRDTNVTVLVGDVSGAAAAADAWRDLARRIAQGSVAVFLKPSALADKDDPVRWLPLQQKGRCRPSHNWVYHREDVAQLHPIFAGLRAGGVMDWYYYLQVTPQTLFDGQEPPEEVMAAAFAPGGESEGDANVFRSGIITASYRLGAGTFVINTLQILENLDQNPVADRLLLNLIRYAQERGNAAPTPLPPDFDEFLKSIRYQ